jgi:S-formylglutathione hydrolase
MSFKTTATIASFGGKLLKLTHNATSTGCEMALNVYLPPQAFSTASGQSKIPVLFYLAGLTCTGDNGAEKGFFQYGASQKGIAVVYPDTSPRISPLFILQFPTIKMFGARLIWLMTRRPKNPR